MGIIDTTPLIDLISYQYFFVWKKGGRRQINLFISEQFNPLTPVKLKHKTFNINFVSFAFSFSFIYT